MIPIKSAVKTISLAQIVPTGESFPPFPLKHQASFFKTCLHPDGAIWAPLDAQKQAWGLEIRHGDTKIERELDMVVESRANVYHEIVAEISFMDGRIADD